MLDRDTVAVRTEDNRTFTTGQIMNLIAKHSGVPDYARELVRNFWNKYGRNEQNNDGLELSVSVHWRFDKEWRTSSNNKKMTNKPAFKEMMNSIEIYPGLLTESILRYIEKKVIEAHGVKFVNLKVYIATPTDETEFIKISSEIMKNITPEFKNIRSVDVLSSYELQKWKQEILVDKSCEWIDDVWFEVSSQMEMFLVESADIFIDSSMVSSWSMLVIKRRSAAKIMSVFDKYVLEVINDEHSEIMRLRTNMSVYRFFTFAERPESLTQENSKLFNKFNK